MAWSVYGNLKTDYIKILTHPAVYEAKLMKQCGDNREPNVSVVLQK